MTMHRNPSRTLFGLVWVLFVEGLAVGTRRGGKEGNEYIIIIYYITGRVCIQYPT